LLWAASRSSKSDLNVFKLLLESGAEILKPKKADGMTTLHIAAASNDVHLVDLILANVENKKLATNLKNLDGWTPTMLASFMNNFDSLNLLMENGADLTLKNGSGLSALDEIVRNDYKDLFECIYD
jgi:ankyrin repeat protein